jgi:hypothetical protein
MSPAVSPAPIISDTRLLFIDDQDGLEVTYTSRFIGPFRSRCGEGCPPLGQRTPRCRAFEGEKAVIAGCCVATTE